MIPTTTLKKLRKIKACKDRYAHLRKRLGKNYGDTTPISLVTILQHNGLEDVLWIPIDVIKGDHLEQRYRLFAVACCQDVLHLTHDKRSADAVRVAHLYAHGEASKQELMVARNAAGDVVWDAAGDAEGVAAWDTARNAARAAARSAARVAAREVVWNSAWAKQTEHFRAIFGAEW